jgi:hypothetical protein
VKADVNEFMRWVSDFQVDIVQSKFVNMFASIPIGHMSVEYKHNKQTNKQTNKTNSMV